jgi:hypothetical protein
VIEVGPGRDQRLRDAHRWTLIDSFLGHQFTGSLVAQASVMPLMQVTPVLQVMHVLHVLLV